MKIIFYLRNWRLVLAALVVSGFSPMGNAVDGTFTNIHHQYQSPRALGMGDAFTAVANDYSVLFYNPAGLARLDYGQINMSIELAGSSSIYQFSKDLNSASNTQGTNTDKFNAYANFLISRYGQQYSLRTNLFEGIWVRPGWGVGIVPAQVTLDIAMHNLGAPALDVRGIGDSTVAYGYGADIKSVPGRFSWGATAKFINRAYVSKEFSALDLVADSNLFKKEDVREGYTVDADLGLLYTPPLPEDWWLGWVRYTRPTFAMVVRNVAETGFGQSLKLINKTNTDKPEKLYRVVDLGSKWEFPSLWIFSGRGTLDFRDLLHPNITLKRSFHAGAEFDWTVASWWKGQYRVGVNQGYYTLGLSALFTLFRLDLATYGEDIGSFDSPKENRMYVLKLNIDI